MSQTERIDALETNDDCTENNFRQLLKNAGITVPNVEFISFDEFIKDKLGSETKEWITIRDGYIEKIKKGLMSIPSDNKKDFKLSIKHLRNASDSLERKDLGRTMFESTRAISTALQEWKENNKITSKNLIYIKKEKELNSHYRKLKFIQDTWEDMVDTAIISVTDYEARISVEWVGGFLQDLQKFTGR